VSTIFQLANVYDGRDPTGLIMQEKFDGVRAMWDGKRFVSRNGNEFKTIPAWKSDGLPDYAVDGELYMGENTLGKLSGLLHKKNPADWEFDNLEFIAFDLPTTGLPYANRLDILDSGENTIIFSVECIFRQHMTQFYDEVLARGGEGIMLKDPNALYKAGRSDNMMKMKPGEGG